MDMTENVKRILLQTGTVLGVYAALRYLLPVTVPFLLGWLLAAMILPAARLLEKKMRWKRSITGGILILFFTAGLCWLLYFFGGLLLKQVGSLFSQLGLWKNQAGIFLDHCCGFVEEYLGISAADTRRFFLYEIGQFQEQLQNKMRPAVLHYLFSTVKGAIALVSGIVIVIVVGILLIKDLEQLREKSMRIPFLVRIRLVTANVCRAGGRYLKAQVIIMSVVAILCTLGFWLLGDPWFLLLGVAVGLLDALPFIGTGTILVPWSLILLIQGSYGSALGHFLLFVVTDLTREILEPKLIGNSLGLHPLLMLVSVYLGFFVYGLPGFLLGPLSILIIRGIWKEWGLLDTENSRFS